MNEKLPQCQNTQLNEHGKGMYHAHTHVCGHCSYMAGYKAGLEESLKIASSAKAINLSCSEDLLNYFMNETKEKIREVGE